MAFKLGDLVFLYKRGLIGWETDDRTATYVKNKLYTVSYINPEGNKIRLHNVNSEVHPDHFKLYELDEENKVRGCNFFRKGDKVKVVLRGKIDWEPEDYTTIDGLKEDQVYQVLSYYISDNGNICIELTNGRGSLHPNHFQLVSFSLGM